jgi:hypothetical protein
MPYEWHLETTQGAARLRCEYVAPAEKPHLKPYGWSARHGADVLTEESAPKGEKGMSNKSRNRMKFALGSLPWELLGERLVMLSLTYPGDWGTWVPDGRVWNRQRRAFLERWRRKWGDPMGVWVKEFQESGRPHLHLYLAVPDSVPDQEFEGLRARTLLRKSLERKYGKYEGRAKLPPIGGQYGGEFAMWLRTAWSEVVGTQGVVKAHHARGVDVTVSFWTDEEARTRDRVTVAKYLAGESGKFAQKKPPAGFFHVGRYWGVIGEHLGFTVAEEDSIVAAAVAYELEHRMERLVRGRMLKQFGHSGLLSRRRAGTGITVLDLRPHETERLLRWSMAAAERKNARRRAKGEPELTEWGPSYYGFPPDVLARLGGEDPSEYVPRRRRRRGPCGCEFGTACNECITVEEIEHANRYGVLCTGDRYCDLCFDPDLHLTERQRASIGL